MKAHIGIDSRTKLIHAAVVAVSVRTNITHHAFLAAALAQMGNKTAAPAHAKEAMRLDPGFSAERYLATLLYRHDSDREHHREALLKAGLPE